MILVHDHGIIATALKYVLTYLGNFLIPVKSSFVLYGTVVAEPDGRVWQLTYQYLVYLILSATVYHANI